MKKMIFALSVGIITVAGSAHALTAMEDAIAREACGGGPILSADYRADGKLEVRCPVGAEVAGASGTVVGGAGVLGGTGLSAGAAAGMLAVVVVLAAASGGSGGNTTTTTTTTTN